MTIVLTYDCAYSAWYLAFPTYKIRLNLVSQACQWPYVFFSLPYISLHFPQFLRKSLNPMAPLGLLAPTSKAAVAMARFFSQIIGWSILKDFRITRLGQKGFVSLTMLNITHSTYKCKRFIVSHCECTLRRFSCKKGI